MAGLIAHGDRLMPIHSCSYLAEENPIVPGLKLKEKVKKLIDANLMTPAGHEVIKIAQENGSWSILDSVEELIIPQDLDEAFQHYAGSKDYFLGLSKSVKKMMLQWIVLAKRPDTRKKRIDEIVARAAEKDRPKQFQ
ncbi:YdeI/OmpD-associated family protein [Sphingobacterium thalpophilum]|uniref:YdeI/OmpD-associated family protein n=1 Tax=Sphingobacterium thalpophilum TaxID=259 RepID=A0ACD5C5L8_9SPHI